MGLRKVGSKEEMKCPVCGNWCQADFVDNGVGSQRCGWYSCDECGWIEEHGMPDAIDINKIPIG